MKLYNTLTRQIDTIQPLQAPKVTVYTCGPTVYDYAHIGHWFNYVRMDTMIRVLKHESYDTDWVMNITDVGHLVSDADDGEDKLEKGARREGKTAWQVAEFYTGEFLHDMQTLHIITPDHITKATEHIAEQIAMIQTLESKGYTYVISDGVYYDTSKFEGYAAFARLDLDGIQAGARVAFNDEKRNSTDFALWKFSPVAGDGDKQRDMEWDSPWTPDDQPRKGFPGWHIECSAMAIKYLGDTLDIHAGGIDHIPVHHTNEIAQSEAATGKRFANYWMHSNHLMVDGEKISKSLGNGVRLSEIIEQGFSPEAIRLHILESHYRSQSQFSFENLTTARNRLASYQQLADLRWQPQNVTPQNDDFFDTVLTEIFEPLSNDLNTPQSLAVLSGYASLLNGLLLSKQNIPAFEKFLDTLDELFGLELSNRPDISNDQESLLNKRLTARENKDFTASDSLREALRSQGIEVRDTPFGQIWSRI